MPKLPLPSLEVINTGSSYLKSALLLERSGEIDLFRPACVLAGLSIEIFIKSFLATDDSKPIDINTKTYSGAVKSERGHALNKLFALLDTNWRQAILAESERIHQNYRLELKLAEYADYFFYGRYDYEASSIGVIRLEILEVAEHFEKICRKLSPKATPRP